MAQLAEMHFQPRSTRLWFMEPEEAIAFLLDSYPTLVENWRVYGEKALTRYKVRMSQPVISAKVESNEKEKWFTLDIDVEYDGQHLPLERIWKAWVRGRRYVQLKDGSYTSLPESWLEKLAHKLQALGFDPTKPPKRQSSSSKPPCSTTCSTHLPNAETDSFWNSLREKVRNFTEVEPVSTPQGPDRHAPQLPAARRFVPELPQRIRVRRHPRGRNGPRQDHPDPVVHPAYGQPRA